MALNFNQLQSSLSNQSSHLILLSTHHWRGRAPPPMIDDNDSRKVIRFREEIKCIDISPDESGLGSEDQLRTLHEIMGSNQSVWTSNIEDIEMATFKWTFLMQ